MGLLDALLGTQNGASQFADKNSNLLSALGAGLAQGPTFSAGLSNAAQLVPQAKTLDKQAATDAATKSATYQYLRGKYPDLADAVDAGLPVTQAWTAALQRDTQANGGDKIAENVKSRSAIADQMALTGQNRQSYILTGNLPGNNRSGLGQPVPFKDKRTGEIVAGMPMSDGTYVDGRNGKPIDDNYTYAPDSQAFQKAAGAASGKVAGGVEAALPVAAQTAQNALDTVAKLRADKAGQDATFGTYGVGPLQIPDQWGFTMPGTPKANFKAMLDQAGGQAFLQAYSTLRGAGAISDSEGQKAGAAISRMTDPNISEAAFNSALDDYEAIIKAGYARIQQQAAATGADPASMPQLTVPTGGQKLYTYNQATGELE